ncbi:MAG: hypothetical protein K2J99_17310 [Lachnospiraceae bacterium]|nr:hypothetical protein [Lachnospiraceae bacterium]
MVVNVLVKSVSKDRNKITPVPYDIPADISTAGDLLNEMVKVCLEQYRKRVQSKGGNDLLKQVETLEERAMSGKVVYGVYSGRKPPDEVEAVENAKDAFEDGVTAIFVDGKRIENLTDQVMLREGSEVMFVKLTALSGSCLLLDWMS